MSDRPLCINSKAERRRQCDDDLGLIQHYEDVYASRFRWTGGPDAMSEDWPERAIYRYGVLGTAEAFDAWQLCGANAGLLSIYGQPLTYYPVTDNATMPDGWQQPHEGPTIYYDNSPSAEINEFIEQMTRGYKCMRSNIRVMSQPVVIEGTIGSELNAKECGDAIDGDKITIYSWDRGGAEARAIDLGGRDHTESIIKILNNFDCEILSRFGIKSPGTEKASGVTAEETLSIGQELRLILERDYRKRMAFCDAVRDKFPDLQVRPAPGLLDNYNTDNIISGNHDSDAPEETFRRSYPDGKAFVRRRSSYRRRLRGPRRITAGGAEAGTRQCGIYAQVMGSPIGTYCSSRCGSSDGTVFACFGRDRVICVPTPYSIAHDADDPRDVFEEIFPDDKDHYAMKRAALWARFENTGIGNCDIDYWVRCMKAKQAVVDDRYKVKFRAWEQYLDSIETDIDMSDGRLETESVNRNYDPPEVTTPAAVAENYLQDQSRTDYVQKSYGGLASQTLRDYSDAVDNPFEAYAREFDKLFHWGL